MRIGRNKYLNHYIHYHNNAIKVVKQYSLTYNK
jgi:hypothetical protein